jgi:hypothetical protein
MGDCAIQYDVRICETACSVFYQMIRRCTSGENWCSQTKCGCEGWIKLGNHTTPYVGFGCVNCAFERRLGWYDLTKPSGSVLSGIC